MIDPQAVFLGLAGVLATAYGIEVGVSFLMRVPRVTVGGDS